MAGEPELRRTFYLLGTITLAGALLYWARPVMIPVTIAVLATFVLAPIVGRMERWGIPRFLAGTIAVVGAAVLLIGIAHVFIVQVGSLTSELPTYKAQISAKVAELRQATKNSWVADVVNVAKDVANNPESANAGEEPKDEPVVTRMEIPIVAVLQTVAGTAAEILVNAVVILVLALLMLMRREDLRNRVIHLLGTCNRISATRALDDASKRVSRFLFFQLLINLGFGAVVTIGLYFIGIPYAYVWGALAALLRYIPFLGGWLAAAFPLLASLVMADWTPFFLTLAFFVTVELLQANLVEPLVFGHSIGVSGAGQVIAMLFWACLWGPVGLILSTPLTACLCVLGHHFPALRFFSTFMGDDEVVEKPAAFYQRLLAGDLPEASGLVEQVLKENSADSVVDEMLIPALLSAQSDHRHEELTTEDRISIIDAVREIFYDVIAPSGNEDGESLPLDEGQKANVLVVEFPFNDEIDEVIVEMLRNSVVPEKTSWTTESAKNGQLDIVSQRLDCDPSVVLITTAAKRNLARIRGACKSVHKLFPNAEMLVCCWSLEMKADPNRPCLKDTGAGKICTTFTQAWQRIDSAARAKGSEAILIETGP